MKQRQSIARQIDGFTSRLDELRVETTRALDTMSSPPIWAVVDLVAALRHLQQAAVLFDRAADQLDGQVVA